MTGYLHVFMTCDVVTEESAAFGNCEESGWIDPRYSRRTVLDSRNDAGSVLSMPLDDVDLAECVRDLVASELGAYETNADGTLYASDSETDYATGRNYRYALHFVDKHYDAARGYVETSFDVDSILTKGE